MKNKLISKRYAKPLLKSAEDKGVTDKVYHNMKLLSSICIKEPLIKKVLQNPILDTQKKKKIIYKIFGDDMNQIIKNFFELLIKKRREALICDIAEVFLKIYDEHTDTKKAYLTTAVKISEDISEKIKEKAKKLGKCKNIRLEEIIDPTIIGGYILRIEDKQIDDSFKLNLKKIKETIVGD